jgi:hypothetical protein
MKTFDIDKELEAHAIATEIPHDKLDKVRAACAAARDLEMEIQNLKEKLAERNRQLQEVRYKGLPDLFMAAGISRLDLAADGNMPAYEARLNDHYHANISQNWPIEQQNESLDWLESEGLGDLIKHTVEISFGKNEHSMFEKLMKSLQKMPALAGRVNVTRGVAWNTLTAWLREKYNGGEELGDVELRKLGAVVGKVVHIKPAKEK